MLQELKRTKVDKIIVQEVQAGKLYIGEFAGAMVIPANIEHAKAMDRVEKVPSLKNYDALGLVDVYPVPHYESALFKKIAKAIIDSYLLLLNLP